MGVVGTFGQRSTNTGHLALPNKSYHHTSDCPTPWPQHCTDPFLYLTSLCTHYCGTQAQTCISVTVSLKNDLPVHFLSTKQTSFLGSAAAATVMQPK